MSNDFKVWWGKEEIFCGEGGMEAAEAAWDHQQEIIDSLEAEVSKMDEIFSDMPADPREV